MVKDCCSSTIRDKQCIRKKDQKIFNLPRKFSFEDCENPNGFTMRSSCAPYKGCYNNKKNKKISSKKQKGGKKKRNTRKRNTRKRNTRRKTNKRKNTRRRTNKRRTLLPKLRPISYENKKHKYKLNDNQKKRRLAIDSGIKQEAKKENKTLKQAALSKKGRFNILRIYRKNNNYKECMTLTKDMKYMDKKYKLGKTNNICLNR